MNLSEKIIDYSRNIGIEIIGITGGEPLHELGPSLENRIEEGLSSPFENSPVSHRIDPQISLPGCKSIICLALSYHRPPVPSDNSGPYGKVARIARCKDYHLFLKEKATQIISFIFKISTHTFMHRIFVDNGPLVERAFARKTDGIIGENTLFISKKYGSWVALGIILLDISLPLWPENRTGGERCLNCGICREMCPTGALFAPYQLDAKRCLSFISQVKGIIPTHYREMLGTRIYGCDTCQDVCPKNMGVAYSPVKEITTPFLSDNIPLIPFININKNEFLYTMGKTSAGWRGLQTLRRNAVIALGNSKNDMAIDPLINILKDDPLPHIRLHAAWSLGKLGGRKSRQALKDALSHEKNDQVCLEINTTLNKS